MENVDDVHILYYGTTEHSIQGMGVYVNVQGERFVNEGLGSSLVNQEVMQQYMARAYLILDEGVRDIIRQTPFCNAAVIGGDRIDHMIEKGMTVVQADSLEELGAKIVAETADGVSFNANNMVGHRECVQRGRRGRARPTSWTCRIWASCLPRRWSRPRSMPFPWSAASWPRSAA